MKGRLRKEKPGRESRPPPHPGRLAGPTQGGGAPAGQASRGVPGCRPGPRSVRVGGGTGAGPSGGRPLDGRPGPRSVPGGWGQGPRAACSLCGDEGRCSRNPCTSGTSCPENHMVWATMEEVRSLETW